MPRVHSKKAAKDYPEKGIVKGQQYYTWKTRPGGRGNGIVHRSATRPSRSQLTGSGFLQFVYSMEDDQLPELSNIDPTEVESQRDSLCDEIREQGSECEEKIQNMPESLQYSPTGELLQERADACEEWASAIESVDIPDEVDEPDDEPLEPEQGKDQTDEEFEVEHDKWEAEVETWQESSDEYDTFLDEMQSAAEEMQEGYPG